MRGDRSLVKKLRLELEKTAATLADRVVLGLAIPAAQHKALIGRGGQHLSEFQQRTGIQVQFPGSRAYQSVGEPENSSELQGVDGADLVKVMGSRESCLAAMEELKVRITFQPAFINNL